MVCGALANLLGVLNCLSKPWEGTVLLARGGFFANLLKTRDIQELSHDFCQNHRSLTTPAGCWASTGAGSSCLKSVGRSGMRRQLRRLVSMPAWRVGGRVVRPTSAPPYDRPSRPPATERRRIRAGTTRLHRNVPQVWQEQCVRVGTIIDARWIEIIDGAFLGGGRLSGLSSGSTRGIAPPAFALASPGRVRAMRGRRREGLGITTFGDQSGRGGLLDAPVTVPFLYSLWGTGTVFLGSISQGASNQPACGRAGRLARATPAPRPGARS